MVSVVVLTLIAAAVLVAGNLRFLDIIPRSRWLSFAGGVSVAYVFVRLLPEIGAGQEVVLRSLHAGLLVSIENHISIIALLGLVVFYGLERTVRASQETVLKRLVVACPQQLHEHSTGEQSRPRHHHEEH
ncbi:hypothetical protein [Methanoculleus taiwanensis]|uniref:hypothetical protein n=1 Tax=Methanoculleus taiwanensis TaxID=1550565 RepID=UPI000FFE4FC1|nr:hypothetical protein [Methanoculleus taiwanensis]